MVEVEGGEKLKSNNFRDISSFLFWMRGKGGREERGRRKMRNK